MKITTLIPVADNAGQPLGDAMIDSIIKGLAKQFSGCTTVGMVEGHSVDGGKLQRDKSLRVEIVCENSRLWEVQQAIIKIGRELSQRSMYFEVRDYDGVQFLAVEAAGD